MNETTGGSSLSIREENAESAPLLAMQGIEKRYGATIALNGVDFEARGGQIHALLGENGAGKSTLMQILAGLTRPDAGQIRLNGNAAAIDSPKEARRQSIAMVHQHFTLVPAFTIAENLALDQPVSHFGKYEAKTAAQPALSRAESLGWKFDPNSRAADLSVGTQQRIEIVKALATDANLLIFDEPTAVLSPPEINELFRVLQALKGEGKAVILIAHKLAEILAVADVVTVLRRGARAAHLPVADTDAPQLAALMMGEAAGIGVRVSGVENSAEADGVKTIQNPKSKIQNAPTPDTRHPIPAFLAEQIDIRGDRGDKAIAGLSLSVGAGEIFGIGGVDGNGQAELAEALAGLRLISSGKMTWNGGGFRPGIAPNTGYIPQDRRRAGLAVTMTIEENLLLEASRQAKYRAGPFLKRRELRTLAADLIQQFDIRTPSALLPASALSGGNQQKIVAARALHSNPEWIVAMNPTRGLDIGAIRFVHAQLRKARERGAAIVLISTDLDEIFALSDRAGILSQGSLAPLDLSAGNAAEIGLLLGGVREQEEREEGRGKREEESAL